MTGSAKDNISEVRRWGDKPYHSLDYELKKRFGGKVYKLSLSSFCSCPNRDGKVGRGGCIFCSEGGSGDFAQAYDGDVDGQIERAKALVSGKLKKEPAGYIAYFQSFTNTYGDPKRLRELFVKAARRDDILALSIATRPDCLPEETMELLTELRSIKPLWVELGLQTSDDRVAGVINRGYRTEVYEEAFHKLKASGIEVITHVILGLPFEDEAASERTVAYVCGLQHEGAHVDGIKLQLMHVLEGTRLAELYKNGEAHLRDYSLEEYAELLSGLIEIIPEDVVIHRLTGDAPKRLLISPKWSGDKKNVLNTVMKHLREKGSFQGKALSSQGRFT